MVLFTQDVLVSLLFASAFTGAIYALSAVSLNLLYSAMRILNIAVGELVMVGAYLSFWLFSLYDVVPLISIIVNFIILGLTGAALYAVIFRRIFSQKRTTSEIEYTSLLIFFGLVLIVQNLASFLWSSQYRSYSYEIPVPYLNARLFTIVLVTALIAAIYFLMAKTWIGRTITYIIQSHEGAAVVGVEVSRVYLLVLTLGLAIAGVAGTLVSLNFVITPFIGFQYTMAGFIAMVLGGIGRISRALPAALALGIVESFGTYLTSPAFRILISYMFFLTLMAARRERMLR